MKNVLFIHQSSELYGSDKTLLLLLKSIDKQKFFCTVVLPTQGPLKEELDLIGIKVIISPVLKLHRNIFRLKHAILFFKDFFSSLSSLKKLHNEDKFDLVYSNTLAVLSGAFFAKQNKIKHIWHVHEIIEHPKLIAWIYPKLLNYFSNVIICNSEATKKNIVSREKNNSQKTVVIYNGIDNYGCEEQSNIYNSDFLYLENDIVITLVGRINKIKGHNWLLKTFNEYFKQFKNVKILIVGSPVKSQEFYLHNLEKYIVSNNLTETVKIIPFTTNLKAIWNITDIAVMPSTEKESFGLVALEAMLAKKPVVASNHGGLTEIVVDSKTGFLVEPNNIVDLKEALEKLINNPELRSDFGENGFKRAVENFSVQNYVSKIEDILQNN
ncbi:MAG: glycosyltransferase family 4 protein [Flavobacterium sp.]|nr:glycosyltransferase family 4 protein [Flavobacterium sp.]